MPSMQNEVLYLQLKWISVLPLNTNHRCKKRRAPSRHFKNLDYLISALDL